MILVLLKNLFFFHTLPVLTCESLSHLIPVLSFFPLKHRFHRFVLFSVCLSSFFVLRPSFPLYVFFLPPPAFSSCHPQWFYSFVFHHLHLFGHLEFIFINLSLVFLTYYIRSIISSFSSSLFVPPFFSSVKDWTHQFYSLHRGWNAYIFLKVDNGQYSRKKNPVVQKLIF